MDGADGMTMMFCLYGDEGIASTTKQVNTCHAREEQSTQRAPLRSIKAGGAAPLCSASPYRWFAWTRRSGCGNGPLLVTGAGRLVMGNCGLMEGGLVTAPTVPREGVLFCPGTKTGRGFTPGGGAMKVPGAPGIWFGFAGT